MASFPPPDAPTRNGWDTVRQKMADSEAEWREKRMAIAVRHRKLRIRSLKTHRLLPVEFHVVSVLKEPSPRKYSFAEIISFLKKQDAIDFIREARTKRSKIRAQEKD